MLKIYFDNSATTKPSECAIEALINSQRNIWGNPSSLHGEGRSANDYLFKLRNDITLSIIGEEHSKKLSRFPGMPGKGGTGKLIFTGSGTESDNLAIYSVFESITNKKPKFVTTDSEHPAVLRTFEKIKSLGADVSYLSTKDGKISIDEIKAKIKEDTDFVSIMLVNNETGAKYNVKEIFDYAKSINPNVITHTDCVQAFQKVEFKPLESNADMVTVSAHKVHGVKGIGALWVNDNIIKKNKLRPQITGGGQEFGYRSGTENMPGIAAFGAAVLDNGLSHAYKEFLEKTSLLRECLLKNLPKNVLINEPKGEFVPYIVSLRLPNKKSQPMLNYLYQNGISVSSGSACSSHNDKVSHVLTAFGLTKDEADSTIRVSFDKNNTEEEVITFCQILSSGIEKLSGKS